LVLCYSGDLVEGADTYIHFNVTYIFWKMFDTGSIHRNTFLNSQHTPGHTSLYFAKPTRTLFQSTPHHIDSGDSYALFYNITSF
jgi:hypothetical protein